MTRSTTSAARTAAAPLTVGTVGRSSGAKSRSSAGAAKGGTRTRKVPPPAPPPPPPPSDQQSDQPGAPPPGTDHSDHHRRLVSIPDEPSFDELITAYQEVPEKYADVLGRFEAKRGTFQELYFAKQIHAGAGVLRPNGRFARLLQKRSLCVRYDGTATASVQPEFETAIWRARRMERQSLLVLGGRSRRVLLEMIYSIIVYMLSVLDATEPADHANEDPEARQERNKRMDSAIRSARDELSRLDKFVVEAAKRASLRDYLLGIPVGMVACGLLIYYADGWTHSLAGKNLDALADQARVCFACGAVGGVVSVMARITRREMLNIDSAQGHGVTALAGAIRPIIGAIFGLALFVFVTGGLVPLDIPTDQWKANLFFASVAFIAGFSERWAQDTIVHSAPSVTFKRVPTDPAAAKSVAPDDTDADAALPDPADDEMSTTPPGPGED